MKLIQKAEDIIKKRIRYLTILPEELTQYIQPGNGESLLLWDMTK